MSNKCILVTVLLLAAAISCNNPSGSQSQVAGDSSAAGAAAAADNASAGPVKSGGFDLSKVPVSDAPIGAFPFFSLPEGMKEMNKPIQRKYDRLFFPIDSVMTPIEGKVWKSFVTTSSGSYDDWSLPFFEKSYDDAIKAVGGVKIFDGKVPQSELDRIKDQATYFGEEGSLDYGNEAVKVYLIRRAGGDDVYIQLSGNSAGGAIQILQKEPFQQTITILNADQITKDLSEKGKAVLHINFDTDKATLKPEGKQAITEIAKALKQDPALTIAINGYTDNTGDPAHNLQLSKDRAAAVMAAIVASGIDKARMESNGFGEQSPIGDNKSEAGKAQNRRVELVKK